MVVGDRAAEGRQLDALGHPGRGRGEAVAALERPADGRPRVPALGELDDLLRRRLLEHGGQHAVVGRDEPPVPGFGRQAAARVPTPGSTTTRKIVPAGKYL